LFECTKFVAAACYTVSQMPENYKVVEDATRACNLYLDLT